MFDPKGADREFTVKPSALGLKNIEKPVTCVLNPELCETCVQLIGAALSGRIADENVSQDPSPQPAADKPCDGPEVLPESRNVKGSFSYRTWRRHDYLVFSHHASLIDLEASSKTGCVLCGQICTDIASVHDSVDLRFDTSDYEPYNPRESGGPRIASWQSDPHEAIEFVLADDVTTCLAAPSQLQDCDRITPSISSLSKSCLALMDQWRRDCIKNHPLCKGAQSRAGGRSRGPRRLVQLSKTSSDSLEHLRLVDVSSVAVADHEIRYTALSYCWGGWTGLKTTKANIANMRLSIPHHDLPQTIRDAITVCLHCNIYFLWVDSLCICQDDPDDWVSEAFNMASVYGGAEFVISALSSSGASDGFLERRTRNAVHLGILKPSADSPVEKRSLYSRQIPITVIGELAKSPLSRRAWALQERALAKAVLHFGSDQLMWECNTLELRSETRQGPPGFYYAGARIYEYSRQAITPDWHGWFLWGQIVEDYTHRSITLASDRLPAIASLADGLRQKHIHSGKYVAGLWEDHLAVHLLWHSNLSWDLESKAALNCRDELVPSWSWAHWNVPVTYAEMPDGACSLDEPPTFETFIVDPHRAQQTVDNAVLLRGHLKTVTYEALQQAVSIETQTLSIASSSIHRAGNAIWYLDENISSLESYHCLRIYTHTDKLMSYSKDQDFFHYMVVKKKGRGNGESVAAVAEASQSWPESLYSRVGLMIFECEHDPSETFRKQDFDLADKSGTLVLFDGEKRTFLLV